MSQQQHARDRCLRKEARSSPVLFFGRFGDIDIETKRNIPARKSKTGVNCESRVSSRRANSVRSVAMECGLCRSGRTRRPARTEVWRQPRGCEFEMSGSGRGEKRF